MPDTTSKPSRRADGTSKSAKIRELLNTGMSARDIAKKVGCKPGLVYVVKFTMKKEGKRGAGRPAKAASPSMNGLSGILDAVKNAERERAQLRGALERIQGILADALGS